MLEERGLQQASPPLISPGGGYRQPHGSQPAALAPWSGKSDATGPQSPPLLAVLPEHEPDVEDKEKTDPCGSNLQTDSKCWPSCHPAAP